MGTKRSHKDARGEAGRRNAGPLIRILAGGRWRADDPARALYDEYVRRLNRPVELVEIDPRLTSPAEQTAREGARMLEAAAATPGRILIALDERGRSLDSPGFADRLRGWQESGAPALVFTIGGADGLAAPVREAADFSLSFGAMTWPHLMVRAMLAEQLYRASAILSGHPYHRA
ncbi:MAG: 23S rRNA (pseudouridine(1915)-N(3))-methyltransferase RlmH [Dongiaceae bacterium]